MLELVEEIKDLDSYTLWAQASYFAQENLVEYIVGLPLVFGIMLLIYSIIKFVFAGSSKPDKDRARHLIWTAVIIILIVILAYSIFVWVSSGSQSGGELPSIFE